MLHNVLCLASLRFPLLMMVAGERYSSFPHHWIMLSHGRHLDAASCQAWIASIRNEAMLIWEECSCPMASFPMTRLEGNPTQLFTPCSTGKPFSTGKSQSGAASIPLTATSEGVLDALVIYHWNSNVQFPWCTPVFSMPPSKLLKTTTIFYTVDDFFMFSSSYPIWRKTWIWGKSLLKAGRQASKQSCSCKYSFIQICLLLEAISGYNCASDCNLCWPSQAAWLLAGCLLRVKGYSSPYLSPPSAQYLCYRHEESGRVLHPCCPYYGESSSSRADKESVSCFVTYWFRTNQNGGAVWSPTPLAHCTHMCLAIFVGTLTVNVISELDCWPLPVWHWDASTAFAQMADSFCINTAHLRASRLA